MDHLWRKGAIAMAASLLLVSAPILAQSGEGETSKSKKHTGQAETASGVIVKVEPLSKNSSSATDAKATAKDGKTSHHHSVRLTINTAAVWRDWVRDQASATPKTPAQAAADGNKSVATSGEPIAPESLVTVDLAHESMVETRYRSATDELSEGAKTPQKAASAEASTDPADTSKPKDEAKSSAKVPAFKIDDLKPGLYVEVKFHQAHEHNHATHVRVMRPVGGANIPAGAENSGKK